MSNLNSFMQPAPRLASSRASSRRGSTSSIASNASSASTAANKKRKASDGHAIRVDLQDIERRVATDKDNPTLINACRFTLQQLSVRINRLSQQQQRLRAMREDGPPKHYVTIRKVQNTVSAQRLVERQNRLEQFKQQEWKEEVKDKEDCVTKLEKEVTDFQQQQIDTVFSSLKDVSVSLAETEQEAKQIIRDYIARSVQAIKGDIASYLTRQKTQKAEKQQRKEQKDREQKEQKDGKENSMDTDTPAPPATLEDAVLQLSALSARVNQLERSSVAPASSASTSSLQNNKKKKSRKNKKKNQQQPLIPQQQSTPAASSPAQPHQQQQLQAQPQQQQVWPQQHKKRNNNNRGRNNNFRNKIPYFLRQTARAMEQHSSPSLPHWPAHPHAHAHHQPLLPSPHAYHAPSNVGFADYAPYSM
jgi:ribosomal protein S17E